VLLQRRRDTGQWAIPMGKQELGETVAQCAVRETREETGVTVEVTALLGIYSDPGHIVAYTDGEVRQEYEIILLGRPVSGQPTASDDLSHRPPARPGISAGFSHGADTPPPRPAGCWKSRPDPGRRGRAVTSRPVATKGTPS
jgi:ADP-ribose pyrophosphatase YjhB (NUDIX family)